MDDPRESAVLAFLDVVANPNELSKVRDLENEVRSREFLVQALEDVAKTCLADVNKVTKHGGAASKLLLDKLDCYQLVIKFEKVNGSWKCTPDIVEREEVTPSGSSLEMDFGVYFLANGTGGFVATLKSKKLLEGLLYLYDWLLKRRHA